MEETDPTEALSVLADETRLDILRALAEADRVLSYTELRERAGVRDSGRFNYHLERLCEYFVRETGEGYALGHAGSRVLAAAGSAVPDREAVDADAVDADTVDAPEGCPVCGDEGCEKLFHLHLDPPWR